jgi:hypothetical protein
VVLDGKMHKKVRDVSGKIRGFVVSMKGELFS